MNTKTLSEKALNVIDQYLHFHMGKVSCSIPYYNNKRREVRAGLRALIGKGNPKDIAEEAEIIMLKEKISIGTLNDETFKWFLVDHNIGIDCSGFAYYILNAEGLAQGKKNINHYLSFPYCKGIFGKIKSKIHPVRVTNVATLAHNENSVPIPLRDVKVGDIVTMIDTKSGRDHILVIHQVNYQDSLPVTIHYSNSIALPIDGQYDHGIRQGKIIINDVEKSVIDQTWDEPNTFERVKGSTTEIRRLRWLA